MLAIFVSTLLGIFYLLKKINMSVYISTQNSLVTLEQDFRNLVSKEEEIRKENLIREEAAIKTVNLYEVTKEICEFLEEDKIFSSFKKGLGKFIYFKECNYLNHIDSQESLFGFEIIALKSKNEIYGYLAISGLKDKERPILDILVAQFLSSIKRTQLYELVQKLSITDSLTKAFTRRHFFDRFNEELRRSSQLALSLSILMVDIDNFKLFNDKYGHLVGDVILRNVADIIRSNSREIDLIGRFGGEEFIIALPVTSKDGAIFAGERIRNAVESTHIRAFDELLNITISIGIATFPQDANTDHELVDKADWALYRSKRMGKNRVSVYARFK